MLVLESIFSGTAAYFSGKIDPAPSKNGPYAYGDPVETGIEQRKKRKEIGMHRTHARSPPTVRVQAVVVPMPITQLHVARL